jgi:hypothetical protein
MAFRQTWTDEEVTALTLAWVHVKRSGHLLGFWDGVLDEFREIMQDPTARNENQLNHKWRTLKARVEFFHDVYIRERNERGAGTSEAVLYSAADDGYKDFYGVKFPYRDAWETLRQVREFGLQQ